MVKDSTLNLDENTWAPDLIRTYFIWCTRSILAEGEKGDDAKPKLCNQRRMGVAIILLGDLSGARYLALGK